MPNNIAFNVRLGEADWDDTMSGWRCPALNVPGAKVEDVYVEGARVDRAKYEVLESLGIIRWAAGNRPTRATASITLTRALSLGTETDRWKRLAIVLPVIATIVAAVISGGATYLANPARTKHPIAEDTKSTAPQDMTDPHIMTVTFINHTGEPVVLYWDSGNGQPTKTADIDNDASYRATTYTGHRWIARSSNGRELWSYTVHGPLKIAEVYITRS
jgi:hypothetical protein